MRMANANMLLLNFLSHEIALVQKSILIISGFKIIAAYHIKLENYRNGASQELELICSSQNEIERIQDDVINHHKCKSK